MDRRSEGSQMSKNPHQTQRKQPNHRWRQVIRIDGLPDDVLLEIFDFCVGSSWYDGKAGVEEWQPLVHVSRRWRRLVLASPRRLNLQLYCTPKTPARDKLDIWPAFPLIVEGNMTLSGMDNIIAVLGESNRVCKVDLELAGRQLEEVLATMQVSFPKLTNLDLHLLSDGETLSIIPDSFLDGSSPRLQYVYLHGIPFPGLPKLLLTATHLVSLSLFNIPHSGYISPEAIVALISVSSSLNALKIEFRSPQSRPDWRTRRPPPQKRSVIPVLTSLCFKGVTEYLEDLVTFIDAPQLNGMEITFLNQIDFDIPRLAQFINRTPKLLKHVVHLQFCDDTACVRLISESESGILEIATSCKEPDWQVSFIEQVCNSSLHFLSAIEDLYISHQYSELVWKDDTIEKTLWLQLLLPFTAVKNLHLFKEFAPGIAAALKELLQVTVLPSLENIIVKQLDLSGPFQKNVEQFVAARQLSDHTITISNWDDDVGWDEDSDWGDWGDYEDSDMEST